MGGPTGRPAGPNLGPMARLIHKWTRVGVGPGLGWAAGFLETLELHG